MRQQISAVCDKMSRPPPKAPERSAWCRSPLKNIQKQLSILGQDMFASLAMSPRPDEETAKIFVT